MNILGLSLYQNFDKKNIQNPNKKEQSAIGCDVNGEEKLSHLFNNFYCNGPALVKATVQAEIPDEINAVLGGRGGCTVHNVCMRHMNNWTCDKTLCQTETEKQVIGPQFLKTSNLVF